jgi:hydroxymethylglutaryl-CoA lyase
MSGRYPAIVYTEEGMREGMQIEDANIPIDAKVALLDALSETGLKRIVVGSFVSPRYTPQMAHTDELVQKFHPIEQGLPPFEVDGDWPWHEAFFPKPSSIHQ